MSVVKETHAWETDAAQYIVKHSESLVVFVDSVVQLQKVASFADSLQSLRAVVAWGDAAVAISKAPTNIVSCATEVMPWADFIAVGKSVSDQTIETAAAAVRPGECCSLIYTSGEFQRNESRYHQHIVWRHITYTVSSTVPFLWWLSCGVMVF